MNGQESNAIAVRTQGGLVAHGSEWEALKEQAKALIKSGFFPRAVNTPEKVIAVMLAGRELGLPPMQSIRAISIVDGKPSLSAETMLALAYQRVPGLAVKVETSENGATVTGNRPGSPSVTVSFTKADAEAAGLLAKDNWRKYRSAMFRARAISAWCRVVTPDAILGCYTPEELEPTAVQGHAAPVIDISTAQEVKESDRAYQAPGEAAQDEAPEPGENDGPEPNTWTGKVKEVKQRSGTKKNGDPWTLYTVVGTDDMEFGTFSASHAAFAREAGTSPVYIKFSLTERGGRNIDTIEAAL